MAGIDCGENCVADFAPNTDIVLTATHPSGLRAQWTGCASNTNNECTLQLSINTQVEVTFLLTTSENEPNNTFSKANLITTSNTVTGFFNAEDDQDYYKIEVTNAGTFKATILHNNVKSYLQLYDNTQNRLTSTGNTPAHTLTYSLVIGTYYLQVSPSASQFDLANAYSLELSGTVLGGTSPDDHEENDSFKVATSITAEGTIEGFFDTRNDPDYFIIEVTNAGTFKATIAHDNVKSYLQLYDNTQNRLTFTGNTPAHTLTYSLAIGTYYLQVSPSASQFDLINAYSLELSIIQE